MFVRRTGFLRDVSKPHVIDCKGIPPFPYQSATCGMS